MTPLPSRTTLGPLPDQSECRVPRFRVREIPEGVGLVWRLSCQLALIGMLGVVTPAWARAQSAENIRWTSSFSIDANGVDGRLTVNAEIDPGFHIYGTTETNGLPTKFILDPALKIKVVEPFEPDTDPHVLFDAAAQAETSQFEGIVGWTAPIRFEDPAAPRPTSFSIKIKGQICNESKCNLFASETTAHRAGPVPMGNLPPDPVAGVNSNPNQSGQRFRPEFAHAVFQGWLTPATPAPGQSATLTIEAEVDPGWSIPPLVGIPGAPSASSQSRPTVIAMHKTNGWPVNSVEARPPEAQDGSSLNRQTWAIEIEVPAGAEPKTYTLGGMFAFQPEGAQVEPRPTAFRFKVEFPVGTAANPGRAPMTFEPGPTYEQVMSAYSDRLVARKTAAGQFGNYSVATVFALALLAGFILNFMPCVLPVIGLKIMSFVQQAGEDPRRVFLLNLAFALGLMSVFMLLAFVASRPSGGGWGGLFQSDPFQIAMLCVVFAFALSFLGVWEIPIPGFSGSGVAGSLAAKEGFVGAFVKGIITTLLATPCSGPLLVPTVIWALAQPAWLTYLTFGAMGLGMALPYLIIGAFPKLIGFLPRPGNWMVTFKHLMGFSMMGAAIFLFGTLKEKFAIPTLSVLLAIGMACWVIGHTSVAAELPAKLKSWGWGLAIIAIGCWISFFVIVSQHELEWNPFSKVLLEEKLGEGRIVFVDFTADW